MTFDMNNKKTKVLLLTLILMLAAVIAAAVFYLNSSTSITVIDLVSKTKTEAESWIKDNKIKESQISFKYEYSEDTAEDIITAQSIAANEKLGDKDTLILTVSSGPDPDKEVTLKDFTGMKQEDIEKWFKENDFSNVTYAFQADKTIEKNVFIKLSVTDSKAKRSDAITVTLSSGSDTSQNEVTVPDFSTYTKANIQAWGSTNQITLTFTEQSSTSIAKGKVISQSVKAGTSVKSGTKISIVISTGKGVTVASYVGKTKTEAEKWISANGLKAVYTEVYNGEAANGTVTEQKPATGTISEGSTVTFYVSVGWVQVADYTGKTKDELNSYIASVNLQKNKSAALKISFIDQESDEKAGTIVSQVLNGTKQSGTAYSAPGGSIQAYVAVGRKLTVVSKANVTETDFKSYLTSLNLKPGNITYSYSDSIAAGSIVSNATGSFTTGSSVNYVLSKGSYKPSDALLAAGSSYSKLTAEIASANALNAGWTVSKQDVSSTKYSSGMINDTCTISGKTIACKVSIGKYVTVPNLDKMTEAQARTACENVGLKLSVRSSIYSDTVASGLVLAQDQTSGSSIAEGTVIYVTLSKGTAPTPACDVYYEHDTSGKCVQIMKTVPEYSKALLSQSLNYDGIVSDTTTLFNNAGFTNLSFVKITGDDNIDGKNTIESISAEPGASIWINTQITIKIYSSK